MPWMGLYRLGTQVLLSLILLTHANAEPIGLLTGPATGTSYHIGQDIAAAAINSGLEVVVKQSEGAVTNIRRLVSQENAALAIVQSDVLGLLNASGDPTAQRIAAQLRLVYPLYDEEVHVLAQKNIKHINHLTGKRVIIGTQGSGTWMTARHILHRLDLQPATLIDHLPPPKAVQALLNGDADALFYVGGKPVTLFANMQTLTQDQRYTNLLKDVHFVSLEPVHQLRQYRVSSIGPDDYTWVKNLTPTVAVQAMLINFDFSQYDTPYTRIRCAQLATLSRALHRHLPSLQRTGHPKWQEVDFTHLASLWKHDSCSRPVRRELTQNDPVQPQFNAILNRPTNPSKPDCSPLQGANNIQKAAPCGEQKKREMQHKNH